MKQMRKIISGLVILASLCFAVVPLDSFAAETGASNLMFDAMPGISSKILPADKKISVSMSLTIDIGKLSTYCGDSNMTSFKWSVGEDVSGLDAWPATFVINFDRSQVIQTKTSTQTITAITGPGSDDSFDGAYASPLNFYGLIECPNGTDIAESARVGVTVGSGAPQYSCIGPDSTGKNVYICSASNLSNCSDAPQCGGKTCSQVSVSLCGKEASTQTPNPSTTPSTGGPGGSGTSQTYSFSIDNPIKGGPNDLFEIINILTKWLLNISIPIAVLFILWAGFLMLTAGATPAKFDKGKTILKNVVIGLAVIFIGRGFITLIFSIIELGATGTGTPTTQNGNIVSNGTVGGECKTASNCNSGLTCDNGMCKRPTGNLNGEPCLGGAQCVTGYSCDLTSAGTKTIDGQKVGSCFAQTRSSIGMRCSGEGQSTCADGLVCISTACSRPGGNFQGDPCLSSGFCSTGLKCDDTKTTSIDGRLYGQCVSR